MKSIQVRCSKAFGPSMSLRRQSQTAASLLAPLSYDQAWALPLTLRSQRGLVYRD